MKTKTLFDISLLDENNINEIKENLILFYGENLGLKNDFKKP